MAALPVNLLTARIPAQEWLTAWVHFDVTQDPVDVEAGEGEDLRELATLQLCFQEEHFALSCADVTITGHDVAPLVDHETSLVHIDIFASIVPTQQELDSALAIPVEDTHDFLQLKGLPIVVVQLGHEATELAELAPVKSFDAISSDDTAVCISQEALE